MDCDTISLILAFVSVILGLIGIWYGYYSQKENKILRTQLSEMTQSMSKTNIQLDYIGTELVRFNNQPMEIKYPELQQENGFWDHIRKHWWKFLIGATIIFLLGLIFGRKKI